MSDPGPAESTVAFIPHDHGPVSPPEVTTRSVVLGMLFGILFGAANAYLGLRVGLTISTSIPVAVLTVAAFRLTRGGMSSILEANLAQTIGSASSSVASGTIYTLPALFLWDLDPTLGQMTLLAACGGLLGVLFMVPLRQLLIVREQKRLPYPEGTACAEVLLASAGARRDAHPVFTGLAVGGLLKAAFGWARILPDHLSVQVPVLPKAVVGLEASPALFGVGFILGPRIATIMVSGGLLSSVVLIPSLAVWGAERSIPLAPETVLTIAQMDADQLWSGYVRYVGAGAVAAGGIMTLLRSFPTMIESIRRAIEHFQTSSDSGSSDRTARDLPFSVVLAGIAVAFFLMVLVPTTFSSLTSVLQRLVAATSVILAAFFFVTVSSRIVGLVGVTSNPISGMTIATLLATASVFSLLGWTGDQGKAAAVTVGCVVAIAASIAGDTSQDLKTGHRVGATPYRQQGGELLGVLSSAVFVSLAVFLLDGAYGFGTAELPAPQASLMKLVVEGVLQESLPWVLVGGGVVLALVAELLRVNSLAFAVGVYLPVATMVPVFLGGLLRLWTERRPGTSKGRSGGILFGSGLVGGEGLVGVGIAATAFSSGGPWSGWGPQWAGPWGAAGTGLTLLGLGWLFWAQARPLSTRSSAANREKNSSKG